MGDAVARRERREVWLERQRLRAMVDAELRRVERQKTLFTMLPPGHAKDALLGAMLGRARAFLEASRTDEAAAILEFVPSAAANRLIDDVIGEARSDG